MPVTPVDRHSGAVQGFQQVVGRGVTVGEPMRRAVELSNHGGIGQRLAEMRALGYITVSADPTDGRAQVVMLTEHGRSVRQAVRHIISAMEAEWSAEVGAADYAVFRSVLDRLGAPITEVTREQT